MKQRLDRCFMTKDRKGNPLIGTRISNTKAGAVNSASRFLHELLETELGGRQGPMYRVYCKAGTGGGYPKLVDDIDFIVHKLDNPYHGIGYVPVRRKDVEEYNRIVEALLNEWKTEEVILL